MSLNVNRKAQGQVQRIRLRRNVNKQEVIQQNLSHMQQSAHKKKLAQEMYYSSQGSRSPLLRTNIDHKASVHNRLGATTSKQLVTKRFTPKNQVGNRIKLRKQILQPEQIIRNNIIRRKTETVVKRLRTPAQTRIMRIRQNTSNQRQSIGNQSNRQNVANQSNRQNIQTGQKVRLRRSRPGPNPVNYTVQVLNNSNKNKQSFKHSVNNALNHKLQQQIRLIQLKNHDDISVPIHPPGTGYTGTPLNERFSQL